MPSSCRDIRAALAECLQQSDCVLVHRHTAMECLHEPLLSTLPTRCRQLQHGYGECRRGLIDMRKRFRGNAPIALSKELEGGGQPGQQLYAGSPTYDPALAASASSQTASTTSSDPNTTPDAAIAKETSRLSKS